MDRNVSKLLSKCGQKKSPEPTEDHRGYGVLVCQ